MSWKERRQWVSQLKDANIIIDVVISRDVGAMCCVWWIDGFDRCTNLSPEPVCGSSGTLREAKRESLKAAASLLFRMVSARGGA